MERLPLAGSASLVSLQGPNQPCPPAASHSRRRNAFWRSWLMGDVYLGRLDALEQIWWVWAQLGDGA